MGGGRAWLSLDGGLGRVFMQVKSQSWRVRYFSVDGENTAETRGHPTDPPWGLWCNTANTRPTQSLFFFAMMQLCCFGLSEFLDVSTWQSGIGNMRQWLHGPKRSRAGTCQSNMMIPSSLFDLPGPIRSLGDSPQRASGRRVQQYEWLCTLCGSHHPAQAVQEVCSQKQCFHRRLPRL